GDRQPRGRAVEWLQRVGLAARTEHRAGELSGGEQQRVAMARALACGPRYLLADEPTGNLDERTGEAVFAMLRALHASAGLTSIVVTHNRRHAAGCDRVLSLRQGKLEEIPVASLP
ncbi:MAG: ATP-binding cassette domain-containing protein, partial [Terriglobales bacterium]